MEASEKSLRTSVEIPVARILIILLSISVGISLFFMGHQMWKKRQLTKKMKAEAAAQAAAAKPEPPKPIVHHVVHHHHHRSTIVKLPGVSAPSTTDQTSAAEPAPAKEVAAAPEPQVAAEKPAPSPARSRTSKKERSVSEVFPAEADQGSSSYGVLPEAYPQKHRTAAPVDSKYTVKRHGEHNLWPGREGEAIQLVKQQRIYGGQRTMERNVEILMQILRDREYTSAFGMASGCDSC